MLSKEKPTSRLTDEEAHGKLISQLQLIINTNNLTANKNQNKPSNQISQPY